MNVEELERGPVVEIAEQPPELVHREPTVEPVTFNPRVILANALLRRAQTFSARAAKTLIFQVGVFNLGILLVFYVKADSKITTTFLSCSLFLFAFSFILMVRRLLLERRSELDLPANLPPELRVHLQLATRDITPQDYEMLCLLDATPTAKISYSDLERIPTFIHTVSLSDEHGNASDPSIENSEPTCCPICCQDFVEGDHVKLLPCFHRFHAACIVPWLAQHARCPVCQFDVRLALFG